MPEMIFDEEKLRELIAQEVKKSLVLTVEDMDEVRKSPAGAIIRLEGKVEKLDLKIENLRETVDEIKSTMATKSTQNLLIVLFLAMLGMMGSLFVKIFFLSDTMKLDTVNPLLH